MRGGCHPSRRTHPDSPGPRPYIFVISFKSTYVYVAVAVRVFGMIPII